MTKQLLLIRSKQFRIGSQWQHNQSLETVMVMGTNEYLDVNIKSDFNVNILTESGARKNMSRREFMLEYTYIPTMTGAYN